MSDHKEEKCLNSMLLEKAVEEISGIEEYEELREMTSDIEAIKMIDNIIEQEKMHAKHLIDYVHNNI